MHVGKIDVVNVAAADGTDGGSTGTVELDPGALAFFDPQFPAGISGFPNRVTFKYDVRSSALPTTIDVEKRGNGDVVLTGTIDNPIGETRILDVLGNGSITTDPGSLIITNRLDIVAANGSIGDAGLEVDLVQYTDRASLQLRPPSLAAFAGQDVEFSYRGIDRTSPGHPFAISCTARRRAFATCRPGDEEADPASEAGRARYSRSRSASPPSSSTTRGPSWVSGREIHTHFRPDDGAATHDPAVFADERVSEFAATENVAFTATVALFADPDPASKADQFTASIDWGDGSSSASTGTVTAFGRRLRRLGIACLQGRSRYVSDRDDRQGTAPPSGRSLHTTANVADAALHPFLTFPVSTVLEGVQEALALLGFTDENVAAPSSDFTVTIDWGDGTTSGGTVSGAGGSFAAQGRHVYRSPGCYVFRITVADHGSVAEGVGLVIVNDVPITPSPAPFTAVEGSPFSGAVATFIDPNPFATASEYSATIAWGDGSSSPGHVTGTRARLLGAGRSHVFGRGRVSGPGDDHRPRQRGHRGDRVVERQRRGCGVGGGHVHRSRGLLPQPHERLVRVHRPQRRRPDRRLHGHDRLGRRPYLARNDQRRRRHLPGRGEPQVCVARFLLGRDHGRRRRRQHDLRLGSAIVVDPPIVAFGTPVAATEGLVFSGEVASFAVPGGLATPGDYSATINWGDGTVTALGTITGSFGSFSVGGTHTYAEEGSHTVTVTVKAVVNPSNSSTATSTATVVDAPLHAGALAIPPVSQHHATSLSLQFTDDNPGATASDFTASINWGDDVTTGGTIFRSGNAFFVSMSHTYARFGDHPVTVPSPTRAARARRRPAPPPSSTRRSPGSPCRSA